jgi:hypothetical protein
MTDLIFYAQYIASKIGKTGLTVTIDVFRLTRSSGAASQIVTGGSATEVGDGLYRYLLSSADPITYDYAAAFKTTDATVDQQDIPALWTSWSLAYATELGRLDDTVTSRLAASGYTVPPTAAAVWAYTNRTLTQTLAQIIAALSGTSITIQRGDTFSITPTVTSNTGYVSIDFTVKRSKSDPDEDALVCIRKNASGVGDGLLYINSLTPTDAGLTSAAGTITVVSATSITIALSAAATKQLPELLDGYYDVQYIFPLSVVNTVASGKCVIDEDVRQAVA